MIIGELSEDPLTGHITEMCDSKRLNPCTVKDCF